MQLRRFTLTPPLSRFQLLQDLLDAHGVPFQVPLDGPAPGQTLVLYATPEQASLWGALIAQHLSPRQVQDEPFEYDPEAWVEAWKSYYDWQRISPRLAVGPDFKENPYQDAKVAVRIAPAQAFGTGVHESTRIALTLLDRYLPAGASLLDVGCGTGVLAIAANLLGAGPVVGFDIEQEAAREAVRNARENGARLHVFRGDIRALTGTFDVVVANMLSFRLVAASAGIKAALKPGGLLVLAGLVHSDEPRFTEDFFAGKEQYVELTRESLHEWWGGAWRKEPS